MINDPAQAIVESNKLVAAADDCQIIINDINRMIEDIPNYWQGVSANIFLQNNQQIRENLEAIKLAMLQISEEIKDLALSAMSV